MKSYASICHAMALNPCSCAGRKIRMVPKHSWLSVRLVQMLPLPRDFKRNLHAHARPVKFCKSRLMKANKGNCSKRCPTGDCCSEVKLSLFVVPCLAPAGSAMSTLCGGHGIQHPPSGSCLTHVFYLAILCLTAIQIDAHTLGAHAIRIMRCE